MCISSRGLVSQLALTPLLHICAEWRNSLHFVQIFAYFIIALYPRFTPRIANIKIYPPLNENRPPIDYKEGMSLKRKAVRAYGV